MDAHTDRRRLPAACASCGYPAAKIRSYEWGQKAKRRKSAWLLAGATSAAARADVSLPPSATGTGRMRHLSGVPRRAKNGFRTGVATSKKAAAASA